MKACLDFLKRQPLITGIIGVAFIACSVRYLGPRMTNELEAGVIRLAYALSGMVFLYLISGERAFDNPKGTTGMTCRILIPSLILPVIGIIGAFSTAIVHGTPLRKGWPLQLLIVAFKFLCVGVLEEIMARGIINDSLLYQFRDTKHIFLIIAIVDILVFGGVHMIGSVIATPMALFLAIMKTLSTGVMGLCYLMLYWKTRNLWGIAIMHGLFDFATFLGQVIFDTGAISTTQDYVNTEEGGGAPALVVMAISLAINAVIALWIWKKHMKDVDFEKIRRTW